MATLNFIYKDKYNRNFLAARLGGFWSSVHLAHSPSIKHSTGSVAEMVELLCPPTADTTATLIGVNSLHEEKQPQTFLTNSFLLGFLSFGPSSCSALLIYRAAP